MAEAGGSLEVVSRDHGAQSQESSLPELQKYLEASEFGVAFLNGRLLCSPKARAFGMAIQSVFLRAMTAATKNRVPILNNNGELLSTRQTLATVSHNELVKVGAKLLDGQKKVDDGKKRTKAEVPEWYPEFPVPDDARIGHSPECLADPEVNAECKGCGRQPSPAEYRELKFRGRVQALKQTEIWLLIDAVLQHFRSKTEELKRLEEFMNRYFEQSKLSIPLQATMGEYFAFLRAEADNRLGVLESPSDNSGRGQSTEGGGLEGLPCGQHGGQGVEAQILAASGVGAAIAMERSLKRGRNADETDTPGALPPAVKPRQTFGYGSALLEHEIIGCYADSDPEWPNELDSVESMWDLFELAELGAAAGDDVNEVCRRERADEHAADDVSTVPSSSSPSTGHSSPRPFAFASDALRCGAVAPGGGLCGPVREQPVEESGRTHLKGEMPGRGFSPEGYIGPLNHAEGPVLEERPGLLGEEMAPLNLRSKVTHLRQEVAEGSERLGSTGKLEPLDMMDISMATGNLELEEAGKPLSLDRRNSVRSCAKRLSWVDRLTIAVRTACCISYFHRTEPPTYLHGKIKMEDLLLDSAKGGKVDLSWEFDCLDISDCADVRADQSWGSLPPRSTMMEEGCLKSDVYSFGVALLELLPGPPRFRNEEKVQSVFRHLSRPSLESCLKEDVPPDQAYDLFRVALLCTEKRAERRPTMDEVHDLLLKQLLFTTIRNGRASPARCGPSDL